MLLWVLLAGGLLVSTQEPVRADAVVVLSGDPLGSRLRAGARVFLATGSARLVAFVQGPGSIYDQERAASAFLQGQGVDLGSVRLLEPGASTAEEAGSLATLATRCGWHRIDVVTSPFHTRRAGWLFRQAMGLGADVRLVSDGEDFDAATWWTSDTATESVLLEWLKLASSARYLFSGPHGPDPGVDC